MTKRIILCVCLASAAAAAGEEAVVVEAEWAGSGSGDPVLLQRLVAWRKGELTLQRYASCTVSLHITKVVAGKFYADRPAAPTGTGNVEVLVLDDAALAWDVVGDRHPSSGRWRLWMLPDGTPYVTDPNDTPIKADIRGAKETIARARRLLQEGKPQEQIDAAMSLRDIRCYGAIPAMLALADSGETVNVPGPIPMVARGVPVKPMAMQVALGDAIRKELPAQARGLRTRSTPTAESTAEEWRQWWQGVLKVEPFPKVTVADGPLREVMSAPMHWPGMHVSPDGMSALVVLSRVDKPSGEVRNGIRYVSFARAAGAKYVYEYPPQEVNRLPDGVVTAWTKDAVAIVWHEYSWDDKQHEVYFLRIGRDGRCDAKPLPLGLGAARNLAICPGGDGWTLAYCTKQGEVHVAKLDATGRPAGSPAKVAEAGTIAGNWNLDQNLLWLAEHGEGAVLAAGERQVNLWWLDRSGQVVRTARADTDEDRDGHSKKPYVVSSGKRICVAWKRSDNYADQLMVRLLDANGEPLMSPAIAADYVAGAARPVATGEDFVLVWQGYEQRPAQVRAVRLGADGKLGRPVVLFDGQRVSYNVGAGVKGDRLTVLIHDWAQWPFRLMLKEAAVP